MNEFKDKLVARRIELGLNKNEMAKKIGWTRMYYSRFESGDLIPSRLNVHKLAKGLELPVAEIIKSLGEDGW